MKYAFKIVSLFTLALFVTVVFSPVSSSAQSMKVAKNFFSSSPTPTPSKTAKASPSPKAAKKTSPSPKATRKAKPSPKPTKTKKPSPKPTSTGKQFFNPKGSPTLKPVPKPTVKASPKATKKPVPKPTVKASPKATKKPVPKPTVKASPKATKKPAPKPSPKVTKTQKPKPSPKVTEKPVKKPIAKPAPEKTPVKVLKNFKLKPPTVSKSLTPREGERCRYLIRWQGRVVGYSKFQVTKAMSLAGEKFFKLDSMSELKIGMGYVEQLTFLSNMIIKADGLRPTHFAGLQKQGGSIHKVDCLITKNSIAQNDLSDAGQTTEIVNLDKEELPFVYMSNLWGRIDTFVEHYWAMIKSGQTGPFLAYDPVLRYQGEMSIEKGEQDKINLAGKTFVARVFYVKDDKGEIMFRIWADKYRNILKMEQPGGGISFELTDSDVVAILNGSPGLDLWEGRVSRSNIFFPNARDISLLKLSVSLLGRGIDRVNFTLPGFSQTFVGEKDESGYKGVFTIETSEPNFKKLAAFPVSEEFPAAVTAYTKSEKGIECEDDILKQKSLEITWKAKNIWDAAKKINEWVARNVPTGIALPSAKMTLLNGQGNSESRAMLAIALCRAEDIPARKVGGIVFSGGNFIPHYWVEVYTGESGWAPLDPSSMESGKLSAGHIRLYDKGEIFSLETKVLDYSPRPEDRVTFINRELTWPVGEERTYVVRKNGQIIGEETALLKELVVLDGKETYLMSLKSNLKLNNNEIKGEASYWMTPQGLPVKYIKKLQKGDWHEEHDFILKGNKFIQSLKNNRMEITREIPVSKGAYLADAQFLCQWALVAGQLPNPVLGKQYSFTIFIPEVLSMETYRAVVKSFETVEAGESFHDAFRVETNGGIVFWIDKKDGQVVKVNFKKQEVDLELKSKKFKI